MSSSEMEIISCKGKELYSEEVSQSVVQPTSVNMSISLLMPDTGGVFS